MQPHPGCFFYTLYAWSGHWQSGKFRLPDLSLRGPEGAVAISQYPAGSQGTPGEYGNFTRHSVENAALYKARAVGNHTTKLGACKALRERRYIGVCGRRSCHETCSLQGGH